MANESMKRVSINRLSMEPSRIIKAILEPDYPHAHLEWNVTGEGIEITPMDRQCVVEPIDFDGDSAKATVTATIPDSPSFVGTSASCDVIVVKQPTAIQLSAVGAPGGYMVTVVQSAESYSRLWKLDAGDVYQGDVCDESGGWQSLPEGGIIDAQSGVLTVVDVDSSHEARRAGSVMLQPSANLACYGPVSSSTVSSSVTGDGSLLIERSGGVVGSYDVLVFPLDLPEGTYTASLVGEGTEGVLAADVRSRDGDKVFTGLYSAVKVFTVEAGDVGDVCMMVGFSDRAPAEASMTVKPMIVSGDHQADMPAWAPGIITRGGVSETRPNLFPRFEPVTSSGVALTPLDGNGLVSLTGTSTASFAFTQVMTLPPGEYVLSQEIVTPSATVSMYDVYARTHGEAGWDQLFTSFMNDVFRVTERREISMEIFINQDKTMDDYRIRFTLRLQ